MQVHFWGVRGSIPAPLQPDQIQAKISAVIQRITERDLVSVETRAQFLASLPSWLFGTVGGNTSCVQITNTKKDIFILDCGSGIRTLGKTIPANKKNVLHIFLSHFHWDHLQGLPFFDPIYNSKNEIHIYSAYPATFKLLEKQMNQPYFPVGIDTFTPNLHVHIFKPADKLIIGNTVITCKKMKHPGSSYAFSFTEKGKKVIFATDVELSDNDLASKENADFFSESDMVILDSQYTTEEAQKKIDWGHSSFSQAVQFAAKCNVKHLFLFHHEPTYDDKKIYSILQSARQCALSANAPNLQVDLAIEGREVTL